MKTYQQNKYTEKAMILDKYFTFLKNKICFRQFNILLNILLVILRTVRHRLEKH